MKRTFILIISLVVFLNYSVMADNISLISTKKYKTKEYYSTIVSDNGKKVYRYSKGLYRDKNGENINKFAMYDYLCVKGDYLYYTTKSSKLCRIRFDGKKEKKYSVRASEIKLIYGGYIYYTYKGLWKVSIKGDNKTKLLDEGVYDYIVNTKGIFVSENDENGNVCINKYSLSGKKIALFAEGFKSLVGDDNCFYAINDDNSTIVKSDYENVDVIYEKKDVEDLIGMRCVIDGRLYVSVGKSVYILSDGGELIAFIKELGDQYLYAKLEKWGNYFIVKYPTWYSREINLYNKDGEFIKNIRYVKKHKTWVIVDKTIKKNRITVKYKKGKNLIVRKYKITK